jgi:uncharacterized protein (DUF2336 family)
MAAAAPAALIAELEGAVDGRSPERRAEILRQLTKLLFSDADRLTETQIGVFDDVLVRLIKGVEARALAQLGNSLSELNLAPREAVRQLAFHEDASVAAPILRRSRHLSEKDLVEIANARGQQHLLALSVRQTINEALSDALVKRGDSTVHHALARNLGARFSKAGCAALVESAERDDRLAARLGSRSDIPPTLRGRLVAKLDDVQMRFLQAMPPAMQEKIQAAIATTPEIPAPKPDYAEARAKVAEFSRTGRLNDSTVNRFAVHHEYECVVAALAFLSGAPIEVIEPLIICDELDGLIVACKAARLNWSTTTMIICNRPDCSPVSTHELEQGKEIFETISLSVAQRTMRVLTGTKCRKQK